MIAAPSCSQQYAVSAISSGVTGTCGVSFLRGTEPVGATVMISLSRAPPFRPNAGGARKYSGVLRPPPEVLRSPGVVGREAGRPRTARRRACPLGQAARIHGGA